MNAVFTAGEKYAGHTHDGQCPGLLSAVYVCSVCRWAAGTAFVLCGLWCQSICWQQPLVNRSF